MKTLITLIIIITLSACASTNQHHSSHQQTAHHHTMSAVHESNGDYIKAKRDYIKEMHHARLGHPPVDGISSTYYNLGRIKGYLCETESAEYFLIKAVEQTKKELKQDGHNTAKYLLELAIFYHDNQRYSASIPYYTRALPMFILNGEKKDDPITLANHYDDYATALDKIGKTSQAEAARSTASNLRADHPNQAAATTPKRYNQDC